VPLADGTLVATPELPPADMIPSLLALSDVMGTGWFAAVAANVQPGKTVVVVGDGAVACSACSLQAVGCRRVIAMSRHLRAAARARIRRDGHRDGARGRWVVRIKELTKALARTRCSSASGPRSR